MTPPYRYGSITCLHCILLIIYHYILSKPLLQQKFLTELVFSHTSNLWKLYTITKIVKKKKTFYEI